MKLTAVDYYERAGTRSREGDDKGAIADLNRAIRSDPRMAIAYFLRGDIKRSGGDAKGAVADFTIGIKLDPKCAPAHVCRGNARRNLGDTKGAISDCNRAINLDANSALAYIGLGMARTQKGISGAIDDFTKAIKLDPKSSEAYFGRGLARTGTKGAISDFTRAIKLNPKHGMAYMMRGEAHRTRSQTNRAIADFTKAIKLNVPYSVHAHGNRGFEFLMKERYKKAIADFDKAIEIEPQLAVAYLGRGQAYIGIGNTDKAIEDLKQAEMLDASLGSFARPLRKSCTPILFQRWAKSYRAAARLDGYCAVKSILNLELGFDATLKVVKETISRNIELIKVAMSLAQPNQSVDFAPVIAKQVYDTEASLCQYIVFFCDMLGVCWLLVDDLKEIDLADILDAGPLVRPTVYRITISHPRAKPFSRCEHARLEKAVMNDLRYDFSEDELSIVFERQSNGLSVLLEEHDELIRSVRSYVSSSEVTVGIGKPSSTEELSPSLRERRSTRTEWGWQEGAVDPDGEHIEVRYGDASNTRYEEWIPIALIGKPRRHVFPVQWLRMLPAIDAAIIGEVHRELDFYLVNKREPTPWAYAIYHCSTGANMYSKVHWSYFPSGQQGERQSSMVIQRSGKQWIIKSAI